MATVSKTFVENRFSSNKATWTLTATGNNVTVSGGSATINAPSMTAKYVFSGKLYADVAIEGGIKIENSNLLPMSFSEVNFTINSSGLGGLISWSSGTTKNLIRSGDVSFPISIPTAALFDENNKTERVVYYSYGYSGAYLASTADKVDFPMDPTSRKTNWYTESAPADEYGYCGYINNIGSITLNVPPSVTLGTPTSSSIYVNVTPYTVPLNSLVAQYGGDISSVTLTVGTKTTTKSYSSHEVLSDSISVTPAETGPITPNITVTDSRGQTALQSLPQITVNSYIQPSLDFNVFRSNSSGVRADEGEYGLITANVIFTDAVADITEPTVEINGTETNNVIWYTALLNTGEVDPSAEIDGVNTTWGDVGSGSTIYGLINGSFSPPDSYQITVTLTDSLGVVSSAITQMLSTAFYTIDFRAGGKEIAFGGPANDTLTTNQEDVGLFKCNMESQFNENVTFNDGAEFNENVTFNDEAEFNEDVTANKDLYLDGILTNSINWDGSSIPASDKIKTIYVRPSDNYNEWVGRFGSQVYTTASGQRKAGGMGSYIGARHPDANINNYIIAYVNPDGTRGYSLSDPAQFRSAIGLGGVGARYSANKNVNTTANADSYVAGASITVPAGTYILIAYGSFPSASTNGVVRVQLYNNTAGSTVATKGAYGSGWLSDQIIWTVAPSASTTYSTRVSSSVARTSAVTYCMAIRII